MAIGLVNAENDKRLHGNEKTSTFFDDVFGVALTVILCCGT